MFDAIIMVLAVFAVLFICVVCVVFGLVRRAAQEITLQKFMHIVTGKHYNPWRIKIYDSKVIVWYINDAYQVCALAEPVKQDVSAQLSGILTRARANLYAGNCEYSEERRHYGY